MKEVTSISSNELICNQHHRQIQWLCLNPHCTQPFCQECLSLHTLSHQKTGTRPMFRQINDLKKQTQQLIQTYEKESLNKESQISLSQIVQLQNKANQWFDRMDKHIKHIKDKCIELVQIKFEEHQEWLKETIKKEKKNLSSQLKSTSKMQHIRKKNQFFKNYEKIDKASKEEFVSLYPTIKCSLIDIFNLENMISSELKYCQNLIDSHLAEVEKHNESSLVQFQAKLTNILSYLETNSQDQQFGKQKNSKSCLKKSTQSQQNAKIVKWAWPVKQSVNKQQLPHGKRNINVRYENREPLKRIYQNNYQAHEQNNSHFTPNLQNAKNLFYNHRAGEQHQQYHINFNKMPNQANNQVGVTYQQNRPSIIIKKLEESPKMNYNFPNPSAQFQINK